jgi:pyridoxamine 5'-phosphate oxidase
MSVTQPISDIRKEYKLKELTEASIASDPVGQFDLWWQEAIDSHIDEVNAMTLATVTPAGLPDARIVLLKGFDQQGFVFYTNYDSQKGQELAAHPQATLVFFWKELERQVRIDGAVEKVQAADSDAYYHSRPKGSQLGAWASPQSEPISDRNVLEDNLRKYTAKFDGAFIPRPPHWGGYRVVPQKMEFWQGRPSRLHDRILYTREPMNPTQLWSIKRLAP